jgi:hypothetical protein
MSAPSSRMSDRAMVLLFGAVFLVVGLGLLFGGLQEARQERAYARNGRVIEAVVTGKSLVRASSEGRGRDTRYEVSYRFKAGGRLVEGVAKVDVERWEALAEGDAFRVAYLPQAPESNRAAEEDNAVTPWVLAALGAVFSGAGGWIVLRAWGAARREP